MTAKTNQDLHEVLYQDSTIKYKGLLSQSKIPSGPGCKFYHKASGKLAFEGSLNSNGSLIQGSWYHQNGNQFYSGPFSNNRAGDSPSTQGTKNIYKIFNDNAEILYSGTLVNGKGDSDEEDIDLLLPMFDASQIMNLSDDEAQKLLNPHFEKICYTKIYHDCDKQEYEGCYIDGYRSGYGKCFFESDGKLRYEGIFKNDLPNGFGALYHENGVKRCEGTFKNGQIDGDCIKIWYDTEVLKYEGSMKNGMSNGPGTWYFENGNMKFQGNFSNDMPHGNDVKIYTGEGNLEYKGSLNKGQRNGYGVLYYFNKVKCYEGNWFKNDMHGETSDNKLYHKNGELMYQGGFKDNKRHGKGKLFYDNGALTSEGVFCDGELEGNNIVYYHNWGGLKFQGSVNNLKDFGWCKRYNSNGKLQLRGYFEKGNVPGDNFKKIDEQPENQETEENPSYQLGTYVTEYYENGLIKRICDVFYNKQGKVVSFEDLNKELAIEEAEKQREDFMATIGKKDPQDEIPKDQLINLLGPENQDEEDSNEDDDVNPEQLENDMNEEEISSDEESGSEELEEGESNDEEPDMVEENNNDEVIQENVESDEEEEDDDNVYTEDQLNAADNLKFEDKLTCLISMQAMGFDVTQELEKIQEEKTKAEQVLTPSNIVNKTPETKPDVKPKQNGLFNGVGKVETQVKSSGLFDLVKKTNIEENPKESGLFSDVGKVENQIKSSGMFGLVNTVPMSSVKSNGLFSDVKK